MEVAVVLQVDKEIHLQLALVKVIMQEPVLAMGLVTQQVVEVVVQVL
jgi:hypothetical protein